MPASNPETIYFAGNCRVWGLNPGPADNRFRLSAHCANEPQRQAYELAGSPGVLLPSLVYRVSVTFVLSDVWVSLIKTLLHRFHVLCNTSSSDCL